MTRKDSDYCEYFLTYIRKRRDLEKRYLNKEYTPKKKDPFKNIVFKVVREDYSQLSFGQAPKVPYCIYTKKDSIDSLDSSLSVLNEYQKDRIKRKIRKENTLYGVSLDMPKNSVAQLNKRPIGRKTTLPASLQNVKANLNNDERRKYNQMFNKINFSNKPSVCKSDLTLNEKVRLLYK
jgi:hypothetical protein